MKKFTILLVILVLISALAACNTNQHSETQVQFYYRTQKIIHGDEYGLITPEKQTITEGKDITDILSQYFSGPKDETLKSPFPSGLEVKQISLDTDKAEIILSDHITELSGADIIVACACLQKTLSSLANINEIRVSAENEIINNQDVIIINTNNILILDTETVNPALEDNQP